MAPKGYDVKKVLRVFIKGEPRAWIEFAIPEGMSFMNMLAQAKMEGWLLASDRMVAFEAIDMAVEIQTTAPPSIHFAPVAGTA